MPNPGTLSGPVTDEAPRSLFGLEPQLCDRTCAKENVVTGSGYAGLMGGNSPLPSHMIYIYIYLSKYLNI